MEQEVLNLANQQIQLAISSALNCLTQISASIFPNPSSNRLLKPHVVLRCRSSSSNRNSPKVPFHNTIPRCSIPATKNDLVHYQSRLLSYQQTNQTRFPTSSNLNCNGTNRTFDIQYSFSLNQSWLTKVNQELSNLSSIQNFADEFVEHSIHTTLLQIEYENLINDHNLSGEDETSCLVSDDCLSVPPIEHPQEINSYVDQFIHSTIEQALENIFSSEIKLFSDHLTEDIIADALSTIADDEIYARPILIDNENYLRKPKKKSIQSENTEQQQTSLVNQILYHTLSTARSSRDNSSSNEESIDSLVNNIAQKIYTNSFDELSRIFTVDNND